MGMPLQSSVNTLQQDRTCKFFAICIPIW